MLNFFRRCSCPADTFSMIYLRLSSKQSSQLFARKIYSALCVSTIKEDARVFVLVNQNSKKIPYLVFESSFSLSIMICIPLSMNCFANKNTVHTGAILNENFELPLFTSQTSLITGKIRNAAPTILSYQHCGVRWY